MAVDATRRRPKLSTVTGGLSGPCIKPIALRMVWQTAQAIKIPVIGMGGITSATDAVEFMLAGASAVQVGTANFLDPTITVKIVDGIREYCENFGFMEASALTGALQID
jgi:dihydroorotate dehydrogenase (NAD+) catalytic subunit